MVRPDVIHKRLAKLDEYLAILHQTRRAIVYRVLQENLDDLEGLRGLYANFL